MPPKVKFTKEQIVDAAVDVVREVGIDSITTRLLATKLGVSTRPIFTYFSTMDELKREIYGKGKNIYREYVEQGLKEKIPFLGAGRGYIRFAKNEPELYKLLFLTKTSDGATGAVESLKFSQELVRESIMKVYNMDALTADHYYRNLWFIAFTYGTLIVTDDCPYSEKEMEATFAEVSLAMCKAFKEIPGFAHGEYDKDNEFIKLVNL